MITDEIDLEKVKHRKFLLQDYSLENLIAVIDHPKYAIAHKNSKVAEDFKTRELTPKEIFMLKILRGIL